MIYTLQEIKKNRWGLFMIFILLVLIMTSSYRGGDFDLFIMSGARFWQGENIYKPGYYENQNVIYYYGYPFSMILSPFSKLPLPLVRTLWRCMNIFFMIEIFRMVMSFLYINNFTQRKKNIFFIVCGAFTVHFINLNISAGQMTIFMLFIALKSITLAEKNRNIAGSSLLAFGIVIKTLPLTILAYILYRGYFKFILLTIGFLVLYFNIPCWIRGYPYCIAQLKDWLSVVSLSDPSAIAREYNIHMHSFTALFLGYLTSDPNSEIGFARNILSLKFKDIYTISLITSAAFSICTLAFINRLPFTQPKTPLHKLREISYIFVLIPLIFPMQQKYSFFFIYPAIAYIIYYLLSDPLISDTKRKTIIILMSLSFMLFITTIDLFFGNSVKLVSQYLKLSSFADLLLIPCLALCRPGEIPLPIVEKV